MKTTSLTTLGLAIALSSTAFAGPDLPPTTTPPPPPPPSDAGFYIGTDAGVFLLQDRSLDLGVLPVSADLHYKTGWGIDVPLGFNFGNGFSAGISAGYYSANLSSISLTPTGDFGYGHHFGHRWHGDTVGFATDGSTELVPLFAEASYSVHLAGALSWNIGVGVGTGYTRSSTDVVYDEEWDFAFEAMTGFSYKVCPNAAVDLGYRYMNVNQIEGSRINGHAIELGFHVNF